MQHYLHLIRQRFQPGNEQPRVFSLQEMAYNRVALPEWSVPLSRDFDYDPREYQRLIHERRDLLNYGEVVCGHLVQANNNLFEEGAEDYPALTLYSHDPYYESKINELRGIANAIYDLKETQPSHPDLEQVAALIKDDYAVVSHYQLPDALTGGREVFMCDLFIFRKHLPAYKLDAMWAPMLVNRQRCRHVMILPDYYWPEALAEMW